MSVLLVAALGAALLAAQAAHARPNARSLSEVDSVYVDASACTDGISDQLERRGFRVASSPRTADAVLVVDVADRISRRSSSAEYSAKLRGDDDFVIFTASGEKFAPSHFELCEDIGSHIAGSMDRMS
jgi:hypothetical protein